MITKHPLLRLSPFVPAHALKALRCRLSRGYTLVEMLAVISVLAVLSGLSIPAMQSPTGAAALSTSAREVSNLISLARSEAIARHTVIRFAISSQAKDGTDTGLRKASLWEWHDESQQFVQLTAWQQLPNGVAFDPNLDDSATGANYNKNAAYAQADGASVRGYYLMSNSGSSAQFADADNIIRYFEFLPSGTVRIDSTVVPARNVVLSLVQGTTDTAGKLTYLTETPSNWAQVNVDTLTGRVRLYRP
ncbi:MAG: Tfp pilus assembly protein FimT/FimU [Verrucomicrobium sp.]|nr:prepilin-type N-terminal cleavage/methylation domain-containing protein [Verrucomicrobium sp.]